MKQFINLGQAIKTIRAESDLSQVQFGKKIGVSGQFLSNCERGLCGLPRPAMRKIVKKYGGEARIWKALERDAKLTAANEFKQIIK